MARHLREAEPPLDARLGRRTSRPRSSAPRSSGSALTFATRPVYDFYEEAPRIWGLSAVQDQNYAGVLMNVEQALVFLIAIGYFVLRLIEEDDI